jgi:hypothetical protein
VLTLGGSSGQIAKFPDPRERTQAHDKAVQLPSRPEA